jgi:hypothetical protein
MPEHPELDVLPEWPTSTISSTSSGSTTIDLVDELRLIRTV